MSFNSQSKIVYQFHLASFLIIIYTRLKQINKIVIFFFYFTEPAFEEKITNK